VRGSFSYGLLVSAIALLAAGCQSAHVGQPLTQTLGGNDSDTQMEFWHQLETRPMTSNDEAFHGLLLYADGQDGSTSYAQRMSTLRERDMLPIGFDRPADEAVNRGTLAVAIAKLLQIRGGVLMHVSGGRVERYAVRELVYLNVYPPSSQNQTFSGAEYVGVIGKLDDYQRGNPANVPAAVLPGEMNSAAPTTQQ
jgi:hypothetical protein